jgi:hypothetical protein
LKNNRLWRKYSEIITKDLQYFKNHKKIKHHFGRVINEAIINNNIEALKILLEYGA